MALVPLLNWISRKWHPFFHVPPCSAANQDALEGAGAIAALVQLLSSSSKVVQAGSAVALSHFVNTSAAIQEAVTAAAAAIPALLRLLDYGSKDGQIEAATALCHLARNSPAFQAAMTAAVPALVLLRDGSSIAAVRARVSDLLAVLAENNAPATASSPAVSAAHPDVQLSSLEAFASSLQPST